MKKIIVLGDSIAKGVVYSDMKKRYTLLKENCVARLSETLPLPVVNCSGMGRTSADLLNTLDEIPLEAGDIVAVECGGNDSDMRWKEIAAAPSRQHEARVPLAVFGENVEKIIARIRESGATPILVPPLPVEANRYFASITRNLDPRAILAWLGDVQHIYRWQERYAGSVREIAAAHDVPLLDLRDAFLAERDFSELYCADGIHPNEKGHAALFRAASLFAETWGGMTPAVQ